jgi:hypothetical protein
LPHPSKIYVYITQQDASHKDKFRLYVIFHRPLRRLYRGCSRGVYIRHMMTCFLGVHTDAALEAPIWYLTESALGAFYMPYDDQLFQASIQTLT